MKKSMQKGFTLIELMIVVAIIAILAAIAIPQYSNYTQRSKVAGAVAGVASYKTAVAMCYQEKGALADCDAGANDIPAAVTAAGDINYVESVAVADGVIDVVTSATAKDGTKLALKLTPDVSTNTAAIQWDMTGTGCAATTPGRGINCSGN